MESNQRKGGYQEADRGETEMNIAPKLPLFTFMVKLMQSQSWQSEMHFKKTPRLQLKAIPESLKVKELSGWTCHLSLKEIENTFTCILNFRLGFGESYGLWSYA